MVTMVGTQTNEKDLVKSLLSLEHDALGAYEETIARLENAQFKARVSEFREEHLRHVQELTVAARKLGIDEIPEGNAVKSAMAAGKIKIADALGSDKSILMAMSTNETDTVAAYERAATKDFISPELKGLFDRAYADEKKHREWMKNAAASSDAKKAA